MGEMADYYCDLAMDIDERWLSPKYIPSGDNSGYFDRDPLHYHTKVFAKEVNSTKKAILIEWNDRDKPVKVWVPRKCIKEQGPGYFFIWKKFWMAKQEEMNWTAEVQEEHDRQKVVEETISCFIGKQDDADEANCSNLVTKKKRVVSCRESETADCSNMISERHKRKMARKAPPPMPETDEFGGF